MSWRRAGAALAAPGRPNAELRVRVGEETFDQIRSDLERLVSEATNTHGGAVVKPTGDGFMVGFTGTVAGLRCAVAIQRAIAERNRGATHPLGVRIGISVGDAVTDAGDLHGTAVVEAARLCEAAGGRTILCSEAVRTLRGRSIATRLATPADDRAHEEVSPC